MFVLDHWGFICYGHIFLTSQSWMQMLTICAQNISSNILYNNCWWLPNLRNLVKSKEESKKKISKRVLLGLIKCLRPWKQHSFFFFFFWIEKNMVYNIFILPRLKPYLVILKFSIYLYWTAGFFFHWHNILKLRCIRITI